MASISSIAMRLPCVCVTPLWSSLCPGEAVALLWENNNPLGLCLSGHMSRDRDVAVNIRAVLILHFRIFADHRRSFNM